jgi:hypothetical protein
MNGVLMQINCIMSLEATKLSNKAKHVDTSKAMCSCWSFKSEKQK